MTKAIGLPEVQSFSLVHELLGARLARAYGLAAPRTEVISISSALLDAIRPDLDEAGVRLDPGLAVGSELVPDLMPFAVPVHLADNELAEAAAIYVFDLLIQNPDRSLTSPNCGRVGSRIVPYDFETAFSFRLAVGRPDPWMVGELPFAKHHLFHNALKTAIVDWPFVFSQFRALPTTVVADVCSTIPEAWAEVADDVRAHLTSVIDHWSEFERQISKSLGRVP